MMQSRTLVTALAVVLSITNGVKGDEVLLSKGEQHPFNSEAAAADRMAFLRGKLELLKISPADQLEKVYALQDSQPLRWSNPVTGVADGCIFVWTDGERPVVVAKSFLSERWGTWTACVQSVADHPLVVTQEGQRVWEPQPDIKFVVVEGEKPAANSTESLRLIRMRGVMRQIQITSIYGEEDPTPWELRLLTAPILRYSSPKRGIVDGAVFAFTQGGTNPEAVGLVEIREQAGVRSCHVAIARLSTYAQTAKLNDVAIYDVPRLERFPMGETRRSFFALRHRFGLYPFAKSSDAAKP